MTGVELQSYYGPKTLFVALTMFGDSKKRKNLALFMAPKFISNFSQPNLSSPKVINCDYKNFIPQRA